MTPLKTDAILTKAETRIASGYTCGMVAKEIAGALDISTHTVVKHTQNIYDKTGIRRSTNALVAWFLEKNLNLDLSEFRRRIGAMVLLGILSLQMAVTDFDQQFTRTSQARRVEARKAGGRRSRREDTYEL